jgi:hypothetical protein
VNVVTAVDADVVELINNAPPGFASEFDGLFFKISSICVDFFTFKDAVLDDHVLQVKHREFRHVSTAECILAFQFKLTVKCSR